MYALYKKFIIHQPHMIVYYSIFFVINEFILDGELSPLTYCIMSDIYLYYEFSLLHIFSLVIQPWMSAYITNLVCYTHFHWFFNPECQHIFGKQTGYICTFSVSLIWTPKNNNNTVDKNRNIYASLNQYHNTE